MEGIFRAAGISDSGTLLAFMREFYGLEGYGFEEEFMRAALEGMLRDESSGRAWLIFVEEGGEPVGYVVVTFGYSLEYGGLNACLDEIYVREVHRGRGLGTGAILFAEEECRSLGVKVLELEVERENTGAQGLYRRLGYEAHDRYLMSKRL